MNQNSKQHIKLLKDDDRWKEVLQSNLFPLCKVLDPDNGLVEHLIGSKVLNRRAADFCKAKDSRYIKNQAIVDAVLRRSFDDFVKFCDALCVTFQVHVIEDFFYENARKAQMPSATGGSDDTDAVPGILPCFDWKDRVQKKMCDLIDIIDPDNGLLRHLVSKKVIPEWTTDSYMRHDGRSARVERLLLALLNKGDRDFQKFLEALEETNQKHVVEMYFSQGSTGYQSPASLKRSFTCPGSVSRCNRPTIANWKDVLLQQYSKLIDDIDPSTDLIKSLENNQVWNKRYAEMLKEVQPECERTAKILDYMRQRSDSDFEHLCFALESTSQEHIVEKYFNSVTSAVQESSSAPTTPMNRLEIGNGDAINEGILNDVRAQLPIGERNPTRLIVPLSAAIEASDETGQPVQEVSVDLREEELGCLLQETNERAYDSGILSLTDAHPDYEGPLPPVAPNLPAAPSVFSDRPVHIEEVKIAPSLRQFYDDNSDQSYLMNKVHRGKCVIFNNENFKSFRRRTGTAIDSKVLSDLFKKLYFKVEEIKDASAEQIQSKLHEMSQDRMLTNDQCLVLFLLSHGELKQDTCIIYGSDEKYFTLQDVINPFAPDNCSYLNGKPKLVFIQACRGEQYDFTRSDGPVENENQPKLSYPDFLIGYPTQAGYRAFRDLDYGSWYINALTQVFMAKAHNTPLTSMMHQVAGIASKWLSKTNRADTDNKTQFAMYTCSFTKDFFFFPGIYE